MPGAGGVWEGRFWRKQQRPTYHQHGCLLQGRAAVIRHSISVHVLLPPVPPPLPPHLAQICAVLGQPGEGGVEVGVGLLVEGQGPAALNVLFWGCSAALDSLLHGQG